MTWPDHRICVGRPMPEGRKYKKSGKKVEEMDLLEQMETYHPFNEQEEMDQS